MVEIYKAGIHEPKGLELIDIEKKSKLISISEVLEAIDTHKLYIVNPKASKITIYQATKKANEYLMNSNSEMKCIRKKIKDTEQYVLVGVTKE